MLIYQRVRFWASKFEFQIIHLVNIQKKTIEHGPVEIVHLPVKKWWFSIVMLVYQKAFIWVNYHQPESTRYSLKPPARYSPLVIMMMITSSTAQGGGGSFKNRKPIGEVGCCE